MNQLCHGHNFTVHTCIHTYSHIHIFSRSFSGLRGHVAILALKQVGSVTCSCGSPHRCLSALLSTHVRLPVIDGRALAPL